MIPIALTVAWSKLTRAAVLSGSIVGAILGMLAWMVSCWKIYGLLSPAIPMSTAAQSHSSSLGSITVANLAEPYSAVCSGLTGLLFSGVITVCVTLARMFPRYHRSRR